MKIKTIHQIVGPNPSNFIKKCIASWEPMDDFGYKRVYWTDRGLLEFAEQYYPFAFDAIRLARNHAEASDIFRYLLLYHYGGIYSDWDIELFMAQEYASFLENYPNGYLLYDRNGTIASEHICSFINESYLLEIVKDIVDIFNSGMRDQIGTPQFSGPYRMQESFRKFPYTKQALLPVKDVFEYDYSEIRGAKSFGNERYMVHYWEHSWVNKN